MGTYHMDEQSGFRRSAGMELILGAVGFRELARRLGISHAAVSQWDEVPAHRIVDIERVTGIPRERLRPDLYRGG